MQFNTVFSAKKFQKLWIKQYPKVAFGVANSLEMHELINVLTISLNSFEIGVPLELY
jgi:hypothetical protein